MAFLRTNRIKEGSSTALSAKFFAKMICLAFLSLAVAGLTAVLTGCAAVAPISSAVGAVNPSSSLQIYNTTELRLQQKNFAIVKPNVIGKSRGFALLGFITLVPAKFTTAMDRLNAQADMKPCTSRALSNLVLEKDSNYYILFSIPHTSIRADVIEFLPEIQPQPITNSTPASPSDSK